MRVSKMLDSIFGAPKTLGSIFGGQQGNSGMERKLESYFIVLKVREYPLGSFLEKQKERRISLTTNQSNLKSQSYVRFSRSIVQVATGFSPGYIFVQRVLRDG